MYLLKVFLCGFLCCSSFLSEAHKYGDPISFIDLIEYEVVEDRIYIQPEQLFITHEGIYIFIQGEQVFVRQLNCDESGIYCMIGDLDKITDKCPNGHKMWCRRCYGCVTRWCKYRCKCAEWE